ncbi:MAG: YlbF family regulator [Clostridia bacterium]|nr:YlbF family regulator [Clostridia bacterium]
MNVIEATRQLGKAIQQDEAYLAFVEARAKNDADTALQEQIAKINMIRMSYMHEASKEDKDESKMEVLNQQFNELYEQIMANENMQAYTQANAKMEQLMQYISQILALCAEGQDPETCEPHQEGCGGSCSSCSGCH